MTDTQYIVNTLNGPIEGTLDQGAIVWRGIPYAQAARFTPAQPIENWHNIRQTKQFGAAAPQANTQNLLTSEDCLFLNIWSPAVDDQKRPVLFYMHGGSFAAAAVPIQ